LTPVDSDIFRPLSLKVPAVVAHAVCFTSVRVALSACWAKPYGFAVSPFLMAGPLLASLAATPMSMFSNVASALRSATSM
jgi:hypothetical protein